MSSRRLCLYVQTLKGTDNSSSFKEVGRTRTDRPDRSLSETESTEQMQMQMSNSASARGSLG